MRSKCRTALMIVAAGMLPAIAAAQIRTPIATDLSAPVPGPAPTNLKAAATSPTTISVSWDAASGVKSYLVERKPAGSTTCCGTSAMLTTAGWQDGSLTGGGEYAYVVTVLYIDGRSGSTEVTAATPYPTITLSSAAIRGSTTFACTYKTGPGPDPGPITPTNYSSPAGAHITWSVASPPGTNYVVERAPSGTTTWKFVGSTCGGPSPIAVSQPDPSTGKSVVGVKDISGGVMWGNNRYTYRVTRLGPSGEVGWNTAHWYSPCSKPPQPSATASGSTVTVTWGTSPINCYNAGSIGSTNPETFTLSTSFGYVKSKSAYGWTKEVIYGVPVGTHTISLVSGWRPDTKSPPLSTTVTVGY